MSRQLNEVSGAEADKIKSLYDLYWRTADPDDKSRYYSPHCRQICRVNPSFAAKNPETIVQYLKQYAVQDQNVASAGEGSKKKGYYTIRPVKMEEIDFGTVEVVTPAGFSTPEEVKYQATQDGWVATRVDLWQKSADSENSASDMLVKVHYWWKNEDGEWKQILHDILYMGPRDGTEGVDGHIIEE
jgi:hypothetical protein